MLASKGFRKQGGTFYRQSGRTEAPLSQCQTATGERFNIMATQQLQPGVIDLQAYRRCLPLQTRRAMPIPIILHHDEHNIAYAVSGRPTWGSSRLALPAIRTLDPSHVSCGLVTY